MTTPDPERLSELGRKLDKIQTRQEQGARRAPPSQSNIAFRFATELVASLIVGGGLGWGIDWLFGHFGYHTRPAFLIVFFVLGAAAGIRGVMRAAKEINAEIARGRSDRENGS